MENYKLKLDRQLVYGIIKTHYDVTAVGYNISVAVRQAEAKYGLCKVTACLLDQMFNIKLSFEELNDIDVDSFCELVSLYDDLEYFEVGIWKD